MTSAAVLKLIDDAPAFSELTAEELRRVGLTELDQALQRVRAAGGNARANVLNEAGEHVGQLVKAEALHEAFAKAALEGVASEVGLMRDLGGRAVKTQIAAAIKRGRKMPLDLNELAAAAQNSLQSQARPGLSVAASAAAEQAGNSALVRISSPPASREAPLASAASAMAGEDAQNLAPLTSSASSPPAPSVGEEEAAETLARNSSEDDDLENVIKDCAPLDHSDVDNGKRLIRYFGEDLLVRSESGAKDVFGTWLCWTGTHWDVDNGATLAAILAQKVGDLIMQEARFIEPTRAERTIIDDGTAARAELKALAARVDVDADHLVEVKQRVATGMAARSAVSRRRSDRRKFGLQTKNRGRMSAMLDCAGPHLRRPPEDFNSDPLRAATNTHTLRFVQVPDPECPDPDVTRLKWVCEARPSHDRADLLTGVIPVNYYKDAECPLWRANLERFQPDADQRRTVQQFAGLGLLGKPIQKVMFHYGSGGNFKSVFLETVMSVLGGSFAVGLPTESIIGGAEGSAGGARPDLERVFGKRMLRILELPSGVGLKSDMIKKLTGGEKWPVRTLYKGFFEFVPIAKPHMSGNDDPQFDGSDGGMRRRLLKVEWPVKIAEEEQRDLDVVVGELLQEAPGILNWLIEGALDYLQNGLFVAAGIRASTDEYFEEMDPTAGFIKDCVSVTPGETVSARAMYNAYKAHCDANPRKPIFETRFGRIMRKKFKRDDKRTRRYLDVSLHDVPEVAPAGESQSDPRDNWEPVNPDMEL